MATVTVGCKLPSGLHLDIPGKGRVTLNGANSSNVIGGHGITENVDAEFLAAWMKMYADHPAVKAGLIFAHEKASSTTAEARDKTKNKSGFEGIDPAKPGPGIEPSKVE